VRRVLVAACLVALWACTPQTGHPPVSDGAPLRPIAAEDITDAVPRADPILALGNASPYSVNGIEYEVMASSRGYREEGVASWYGTKFHGRQTSNGEVYDLYAATAAHKTLPIPSYARVTNLENGRSMVVRVNDRGPFHADRLIDLSYGAAVKLGYMEQGTARVRVEALHIAGVDDRRLHDGGHYRYLQVGAFGQESSALRLQSELIAQVSVPVAVSPVQQGAGMLYRVRLGPVGGSEEMQALQALLDERGYGRGQPLP
jgi:rare lipoprotein A